MDKKVLLIPVTCAPILLSQAQVTQQANLMAGKRAPPVWALLAIMFFGWNEMMAVLWNPIYLVLGFVCFLVGWQLYSELDVDSEMQRGTITGLLSIYNNMGDALRSVGHLETGTAGLAFSAGSCNGNRFSQHAHGVEHCLECLYE